MLVLRRAKAGGRVYDVEAAEGRSKDQHKHNEDDNAFHKLDLQRSS